jgi:hypothetical protein
VAAVETPIAPSGVGAPPAFKRSAVPASIVPLAGLPFVGLIVVGIVVAIAGDWPWALTFFHVVGGGLWTGVDLFMGFVIGPIMRRLSIPARIELTARLMPKMLLIMPTLVTMTLAAGFQLARINGMLSGDYPRHAWVVVSMVVVAVMAVTALGLLQPANVAVLFELRKPQPNPAIIGALMRRFVYAAAVIGAMQVATLIIMTRLAS